MPTKITPALLEDYFSRGKTHSIYKKTLQQYARLRRHADGEVPEEMLDQARPNEEEHVKAYRKIIFSTVTMGVFTKLLGAFEKGRKSRDWHIGFDTNKVPGGLREEEWLQVYFEKEYPFYNNFTAYLFDYLLRPYLIDPNGVVAAIPVGMELDPGKLPRPFGYVFHSENVLEFKAEDYAILKSSDQVTYEDIAGNRYQDGKVIYVLTTQVIQRFEQIDSSGTMALKVEMVHNSGRLPCRKHGGRLVKAYGSDFLYASRIDAVADRLNEASREWNDFQITKILNMHLEKWEYDEQECDKCTGGKIITPLEGGGSSVTTCGTCGGSTYKNKGPAGVIKIRPKANNEIQAPNPPAGYVLRDVETLKFMDTQIEKHIWYALSAVNMENLMKTPLNESGLAKEVDAEGANILVHSVMEDLVGLADWIAWWAAELRYLVRVPQEKVRREMVPLIVTPEKFDLLNSAYYLQSLKDARAAGVSPTIISSLEAEFAAKQFSSEPEKKRELMLIQRLDPQPGIDENTKIQRLMNGGLSKLDYVITSNIGPWMRDILEEIGLQNLAGPKLLEKVRTELVKRAQEKIAENNEAAKRILDEVNSEEDDEEVDPQDPSKPKKKEAA